MTDTTTNAPERQMTLDELQLRLDQIQPHPDNVRSDVGDITELRESIERHGVRQPVIVYWDVDAHVFRLIAGERRWTAATELGIETIPAVIRPEPDILSLLEQMLSENNHRAPLDPIDEAKALLRIKTEGSYTRLEQIAANVNRSKEWVAGRLKLIQGLPESTWSKVSSGEVPIGDALAVAKINIDDESKAELLDTPAINRSAAIARKADQIRKDTRAAELRAVHGDDIVSHPPRQSSAYPWGVVRLGTGPGELNLLTELHAGTCEGHVAVWTDYQQTDVAGYCTTPLSHDWGAHIPLIEELGKTVPIEGIGHEWNHQVRYAHAVICPHRQRLEFPWGDVEVCTDPTIHTSKRRKGYAGPDQLLEQHRAQSGETPPTPLWKVPTDVVDRLRTGVLEQIAALPDWVCEALVLDSGVGAEADDDDARAVLVRTTADSLRGELANLVRNPASYGDDDRLIIGSLIWSLQQCVDAGAAPPNLDEIRTRIDVITKGETEVAGDA